MEKNNKGLIIIIVLLCIIILGMGGFIIYDNFLKDNSNDDNDNSIQNSESNKNIPINDKFAFAIETLYSNQNDLNGTKTAQIYLLDNGYLYYKILTENEINDDNYYSFDFINEKKLEKFTKLNNIKRIKGTNTISTGLAFNLLLITNDGKVYDLIYNLNGFLLSVNRDFEDYEVDDILEYESVNGCMDETVCNPTYKIKLLDGKVITK